MNREAELISLLITGFAVAFLGWALVHLASSPNNPNKEDQRATQSRFRRWLAATRNRMLKVHCCIRATAQAVQIVADDYHRLIGSLL